MRGKIDEEDADGVRKSGNVASQRRRELSTIYVSTKADGEQCKSVTGKTRAAEEELKVERERF